MKFSYSHLHQILGKSNPQNNYPNSSSNPKVFEKINLLHQICNQTLHLGLLEQSQSEFRSFQLSAEVSKQVLDNIIGLLALVGMTGHVEGHPSLHVKYAEWLRDALGRQKSIRHIMVKVEDGLQFNLRINSTISILVNQIDTFESKKMQGLHLPAEDQQSHLKYILTNIKVLNIILFRGIDELSTHVDQAKPANPQATDYDEHLDTDIVSDSSYQ